MSRQGSTGPVPPPGSVSRRQRLLLAGLAGAALLMTALHHVDHVVRGAVGWPLAPHVNPFTASLAAYPVIVVGLAFLARGRLWPAFWAVVGLAGTVSVVAVHLGPEPVWLIPDSYGSPWPVAAALGVLAALLLSTGGLLVSAVVVWRARRRRGAGLPPAPVRPDRRR